MSESVAGVLLLIIAVAFFSVGLLLFVVLMLAEDDLRTKSMRITCSITWMISSITLAALVFITTPETRFYLFILTATLMFAAMTLFLFSNKKDAE